MNNQCVLQTASRLRGVLPVLVDGDVGEDAGEALDDTFIPDAEVWYVAATVLKVSGTD